MAILVERDHMGIFGKMNAGKSSLMNLITQQQTSIVDPTPGTTADTKLALMELHGLGPIKLYDTAGLDEVHELGQKKRKKALSDLKECDLVLVIIDPASPDLSVEQQLIELAREWDKQILLVYNIFDAHNTKASTPSRSKTADLEKKYPVLTHYARITLRANENKYRQPLLKFILNNFESKKHQTELLPFLKKDEYYILNIPMDEQTPPGRYLRPQAMCEEYITRHWAYPVSYRMDLKKARANDPREKKRFNNLLKNLKKRPAAIITDSQAMDIMQPWTPLDIQLTTFSIMMINYVSRGRLAEFARGARALDTLKKGDQVLIVEACNHSRIQEDIGTVQIPRKLQALCPGVKIEHNFGREFQENEQLGAYRLIIHCGGCMISSQKLLARIRELSHLGVPYTNYGVILAYFQGKPALQRVLKPWKIKLS